MSLQEKMFSEVENWMAKLVPRNIGGVVAGVDTVKPKATH